jgi:hypothetical protein
MIIRPAIVFVLLLIKLALSAQVFDRQSFFNDTYNKHQIKESRIKEISIQGFIVERKNSPATFYFDRKGYLQREVIKDTSGRLQ